jgi:hypothetical protein
MYPVEDMYPNYLENIHAVLHKAVSHYSRVYGVRVDLKFPEGEFYTTNEVITKFGASLQAQVNADQNAKRSRGIRVHGCKVRLAWAREIDQSVNPHFHLLILFNYNAYNTIGNINNDGDNLAFRIRNAWASALGCPFEKAKKGVHFPRNRNYFISKGPTLRGDVEAIFYRASYMAKRRSKDFTDGQRNFGCSQN